MQIYSSQSLSVSRSKKVCKICIRSNLRPIQTSKQPGFQNHQEITRISSLKQESARPLIETLLLQVVN